MDEQEQHLNTDRARAGQTPHTARYVLVISTVLVVIAFAIILLVAG